MTAAGITEQQIRDDAAAEHVDGMTRAAQALAERVRDAERLFLTDIASVQRTYTLRLSVLDPGPAGTAALSPDAADALVPGEADGDDGSDHPESRDCASLLPTGELMNPACPEEARYYDIDQVAYVVTNSAGQVRVLTSFGTLPGWDTGTGHAIRHDQTWYPLGTWRVTGISNYRTRLVLGEIPDRPLRHWVFK
jgi:hypothetical protein